MEKFEFNPVEVFEDETHFKNPKSAKEARSMLSLPLKQLRDFINSFVTNILTANEVEQKIAEASFKSGSADMFKAQYDADGDGIVDNAKKVNGHTVETDVPIGAVFKYEPATETKDGLMTSDEHNKLKTVPKFYSGSTFVEPADWNVGDVYWVIGE